MFGLIRLLVTLTLLGGAVLVGGVALIGFLVFKGSPRPCVDRVVSQSPLALGQLVGDWSRVLRGTTTITVNEDEATSYGADYLRLKDVPVDDLRVHFCPDGTPEATARVKAVGLKTNVLVRGRLDVSGHQPKIVIEEVRAGSLPGWLSKPMVDFLVREQKFVTLVLPGRISSIRYTDGAAIVTAGP